MHELIRQLRLHWFALMAAGVALIATLCTWPLSQRFPFALFIVAVMVSAWRGGLRPGLVTTGASAVALLLLFLIFPAVKAAESGEHFAMRLMMFMLIGVLAGYLSMKCKEAVLAHDRFHDAIASMGESLIFTDAHGKITFLNATAQTLTGLSPAAAEGKPFGEIVNLLHEESRLPLEDPALWTLQANTPAALPDGTLLRSIANIETPIEGSAIPLHDADNRLVGVAIAFHSATARRMKEEDLRQREQRFRTALGSAPAALLLLDARGHCLFTNRACQVLGGFSFDEGLGQGWTRCIHLDDRDRLLSDWSAAVQAAAGTFRFEFRLNTKGDETRRLCLQATTIVSDQGQPVGQVATIEDLTELIRAQEARQENEDRAERAEAARRTSEEQAAGAAQRQKKFEDALSQLREELQRQLQAGAETKRQAEEKLNALEEAKQQAERARDDLSRRLEETDTARRQAEETLHGSQLEFARLMDEHLAAQRKAEESLQHARDDFAAQLASARREAEEALRGQPEEFDPAELERHAAARRDAEDALIAARQNHAQEVDQLTNDSLAEMAALEEKLTQARHGEAAARNENGCLQSEITALQTMLAESSESLSSTRRSLEELTREKERLAEVARTVASSIPLPQETQTNGHAQSIEWTPAVRRPIEAGDWLSFN